MVFVKWYYNGKQWEVFILEQRIEISNSGGLSPSNTIIVGLILFNCLSGHHLTDKDHLYDYRHYSRCHKVAKDLHSQEEISNKEYI